MEDTLREAGSGNFGEFELCDLIVMLNNYAITEKATGNLIDVGDSGSAFGPESSETAYLCDVAHALLVFLEKLVNTLRTAKTLFENNPGAKGAVAALRNYERFHTPDDTEFDMAFDGPTGNGLMGNPLGCLNFFEKLGLTKSDFDSLCRYVDAFEKFLRGREGNEASLERDRISNLVDKLMELIHKMYAAFQTPE